jgi:hypothetical protein
VEKEEEGEEDMRIENESRGGKASRTNRKGESKGKRAIPYVSRRAREREKVRV